MFSDWTDDEKTGHRLVFFTHLFFYTFLTNIHSLAVQGVSICFLDFLRFFSWLLGFFFNRTAGCFSLLLGFFQVFQMTSRSFQLAVEKISGFQLARRSPWFQLAAIISGFSVGQQVVSVGFWDFLRFFSWPVGHFSWLTRKFQAFSWLAGHLDFSWHAIKHLDFSWPPYWISTKKHGGYPPRPSKSC